MLSAAAKPNGSAKLKTVGLPTKVAMTHSTLMIGYGPQVGGPHEGPAATVHRQNHVRQHLVRYGLEVESSESRSDIQFRACLLRFAGFGHHIRTGFEVRAIC